jgi:hypothetical protein
MIGHEARQSSDLKALHWQTRPRGGIGQQGLFRLVANPRRTILSRSRDTSVRACCRLASGHRRSEIPPRSGRGGRRFKSCHSDHYLAEIESAIATGSATDWRDEERTPHCKACSAIPRLTSATFATTAMPLSTIFVRYHVAGADLCALNRPRAQRAHAAVLRLGIRFFRPGEHVGVLCLGRNLRPVFAKGTAALLVPLANVLVSATSGWKAAFIIASLFKRHRRAHGAVRPKADAAEGDG